MKRRGIIQGFLYTSLALVFPRLVRGSERPEDGAVFRVVYVDPDGSGADLRGHLGRLVTNAERCCENCTMIFGTLSKRKDGSPYEAGFVRGELIPLNKQAMRIHGEIEAKYDFWTGLPKPRKG
jgi:hypothetical protein